MMQVVFDDINEFLSEMKLLNRKPGSVVRIWRTCENNTTGEGTFRGFSAAFRYGQELYLLELPNLAYTIAGEKEKNAVEKEKITVACAKLNEGLLRLGSDIRSGEYRVVQG